jgi:hypothetical protein
MSSQQQQHAIHVLFLEASPGDPWLNRLTSAIGSGVHGGRGFCHVEICVPRCDYAAASSRGHGDYLSSSIYNGETVTSTSVKTFANPGYTVHTELVSQHQLQALHDGIASANRRGVGFDALGMVASALPFYAGLASGSRTFCSRYVTELLQAAGVGGAEVRALDARITTPSKLHRVLMLQQRASGGSGGVVGTVPFKLARLIGSCAGGKNSRGCGYEPLHQHQLQIPPASLFSIE